MNQHFQNFGGSFPLLEDHEQLRAEWRRRRDRFTYKSVHPADVELFLENHWAVQRKGKRAVRLKREKEHHKWLEDRVWCLLHQMGFSQLNGEECVIEYQRSDGSAGRKQIDVRL